METESTYCSRPSPDRRLGMVLQGKGRRLGMVRLPTRGQHAYRRPGKHCSKSPEPLSIPTYLLIPQFFTSHLLSSLPTWKAGRQVSGRRKGGHHLNSLITLLQALLGKVREKKQVRKEATNGAKNYNRDGNMFQFPHSTRLP